MTDPKKTKSVNLKPTQLEPTLTKQLNHIPVKEQEIVKQCFQTGNQTQMSMIPDGVRNVQDNLEKKQVDNLVMSRPKYINLVGGGLFTEFEWMPEPYDLAHVDRIVRREDHRALIKDLHDNREFIPSVAHSKIKNETITEEKIGYLHENDPQKSIFDVEKRIELLNACKQIQAEFKPPDRSGNLGKSAMRDIINVIRIHLVRDQDDAKFVIATNQDDNIEIRFDLDTVDSLNGLIAQMNNMISQCTDVTQYKLRRVVEQWALVDSNDKQIQFMLSPPWVKSKKNQELSLKNFTAEGN